MLTAKCCFFSLPMHQRSLFCALKAKYAPSTESRGHESYRIAWRRFIACFPAILWNETSPVLVTFLPHRRPCPSLFQCSYMPNIHDLVSHGFSTAIVLADTPTNRCLSSLSAVSASITPALRMHRLMNLSSADLSWSAKQVLKLVSMNKLKASRLKTYPGPPPTYHSLPRIRGDLKEAEA